MTDDLIQEMSKRLGRSEAEVEKAFQAFASAVEDRLRSEGKANLAGLGTLTGEGDDAEFAPSEALSQAVNYRWLGPAAPVVAGSPRPPSDAASTVSVLPPDEVTPAITPDLLEDPPMPDDQKPIRKVSWAPIDEVDPTDLGQPSKPEAEPQSVSASAPDFAPAASVSPPVPPSAASEGVPPTPAAPPSTEVMPELVPPVDPVFDGATADDLTYEGLHKPEAAAAATSAVAGASRSATRRSATGSGSSETNRRALVGLLAALAIVVVAVILWNQFGSGSSDPDGAIAETEQQAAPQEGEGAPVAEDPGNSETDPAAESGTPPAEAGATPPAANSTPTAINPNSSGYTLIVGSTLSRGAADRAAAQYAGLGHPVAVLSYPDGDGNTRHRIAVGEFDSADDADSARRAMDSRLPDGTWVRRIRR
ncbi:MAG: hypothetical protein HKN29_12575 [Rhodothermales bacterium]|nr:hypothetical protein [Rhodothermales bacterium]